MSQAVSQTRGQFVKVNQPESRRRGAKRTQTQTALSTDRYLLYSAKNVDEMSALRLLAAHLSADLVEDQHLLARNLNTRGRFLVFSRIDPQTQLQSETLLERLEEIEALTQVMGPELEIFWAGLVKGARSSSGRAFIFPDIIPVANHFWLSDLSSLFALDSDFWFHECLQRNSSQVQVHIAGISESLASLLECTRWRFGRMELELFCRDLLRTSEGERVLGLHHLPHWFHHPILAFIQNQLLENNRDF